jgi:hypothetical protein
MADGNHNFGPDIAHVRNAMREHDRDNPPILAHRAEHERRAQAEEEEGSDSGDLTETPQPDSASDEPRPEPRSERG